MKQKFKIDPLFLIAFILSTYFKLNNLSNIEYKFDQQFGFNVLKNCSNGEFFSYIDGSTGLPQGLLHYFFECLGGVLGISSYLNLVRFEIILSQISLLLIYLLLAKNFSYLVAGACVSLVLLNPYLIIASRNISSAEHYEMYILIYIYLLINFKKNKNGGFLLAGFSSLALIIYFPMFIFFTSFLLVISLAETKKSKFKLCLGYGLGLLINFITYIPYFINNGIPITRNSSTSWGISSYWRTLFDTLSGSSIQTKVNNQNDFNNLLENFNFFDNLILFNKVIFMIMFSIYIIQLISKMRDREVRNFDKLTLTSLTLTGVIFSILDRPLYAHYYFSVIIFIYLSLVIALRKKFLILFFCGFISFSNILLTHNFFQFINLNNGAINSDYGIIYSKCGCCVEDARVCRGQ